MNSRINNTCGGSFSTIGWLYWKTPLCVFRPVLCSVFCSRGLGSINHPSSGLYYGSKKLLIAFLIPLKQCTMSLMHFTGF